MKKEEVRPNKKETSIGWNKGKANGNWLKTAIE